MSKYVIQNKEDLVFFDNKIVKKIKQMALKNEKKRARICIHKSLKDKTNEMIIALNKKSFIAPHIHPNGKSESYFVIEGNMNVYVFDKSGKVKKVVRMGPYNSGKNFFYRMSKGFYHMPIALTKWCVYHEVYSGPFVKNVDVRYPSWSPSEKNKNEKMKFLRKIGHI
ncbi:MAG: hypothetical protein CBC25_00055 [Pelagibacteraceae bacterium TMED65]|nr:MAG: hypothetical protein CBC25_00055 [Pelagibacteraceae bacterium TMED65]|tara:strand:+ start:7127 stop:7627 length:501 start_codon:yes stop_codon:yes gene_type:complete